MSVNGLIHHLEGNGELMAATYKDRNARQAVISGSYLLQESRWEMLTTRMDMNGKVAR